MNDQTFALFLKACSRRVFEEDASVTAELIKEELLKDEPLNAVRQLYGTCCTLLRQAGFEGDLTADALAKAKLTPEQKSVASRFWATQKEAAQRVLADKSRGTQGRLESFEWRVDSKQLGDRNESSTVVALQTGGETLHFEMNAQQLQDVIATFAEIRKTLEEKAK